MYMYMEKHVIYNFSAAAIRAVAAIAYEAYMTKPYLQITAQFPSYLILAKFLREPCIIESNFF